jgi:UDP-GlcNAc:undecaprenyl-phosphate GlcNAc-1-phosphate transferase
MPLSTDQLWWLVPVIAFITAIFTLLLIPVARKTGLVDHPNHRKLHDSATPVIGGLAIFIVLFVAVYCNLPGSRFVTALGAGALLMTITGMVDDRLQLSAALRFLIQIGACLLMILYADLRLDDFGRLIHNEVLALGWMGGPITIFAALGVINAFNMIDGMDGLAGSVFLVAASGMAVFAAQSEQSELLWILLLSIGVVLGFLLLNARFPWNKKARAFLGDGGSLLLGFILAWCFISLGSDHGADSERAFMPMTAVWLLAVPLLDTTTVMWRRWRSGRSAFSADQNHLHHAFLRAGFSVRETWINITFLAIVCSGLGLLFEILVVPSYVSFWTFMIFAFSYYAYIKRSWETQRFLNRNFIYNDFEL